MELTYENQHLAIFQINQPSRSLSNLLILIFPNIDFQRLNNLTGHLWKN